MTCETPPTPKVARPCPIGANYPILKVFFFFFEKETNGFY